MPVNADSPKFSILHVLTLNGRNGEYGGPVRVARELCSELNSRGHSTRIFTGALKGSEPISKPGLDETFVLVKPLLKRLPMSSLWSWKLLRSLHKMVQKSDVIHVHFARDLIPFLAAFLAILNKKPFISQTHGMIIPDGRTITRLIDLIFTKYLIGQSRTNLVLTQKELALTHKLFKSVPSMILPNGIFVDMSLELKKDFTNKIVFCSRLHKRKGLDKFIQIAQEYKKTQLSFEIYGPDEGELHFIETEIKNRNLEETVQYKGSLPAESVQKILLDADLLVLPSQNEPFPMVILEAIAVGTSVLIMPSCGLADSLRNYNPDFVSENEEIDEIVRTFNRIVCSKIDQEKRTNIRNFAQKEFSIAAVADVLIEIYRDLVNEEIIVRLNTRKNKNAGF